MVLMNNKENEQITYYFHYFQRLRERAEASSNKTYDHFIDLFDKYYYQEKMKDDSKWDSLFKDFWQSICDDYSELLITKIDNLKNKGIELSKLKKNINKIKQNIHKSPGIEEFEKTFEELSSIDDLIDDKQDIVIFQFKRFILAILFGFILGIVGSLIGGIILNTLI